MLIIKLYRILIIILFSSLLLFADNQIKAQEIDNSDWFIKVVTYLWFSNVDGSQTIGDYCVSVSDTVLNRNIALQLEIGNGRILGLVKLSRSNQDNFVTVTRITNPDVSIPINYSFSWFTAELFAAALIGPFEKRYGIELYAGGRYIRHKQSLIDSTTSASIKNITEKWIEPVVGWRLTMKLSKRFWSRVSNDIGGFGIDSDYTWTRGFELGFNVIKSIELALNYNYLEVQYNNGNNDSDSYIWERGVQQGWYLGLAIKI